MSDRLILKTCDIQPAHAILICAAKFKGIQAAYQTLRNAPPQFIDNGNTIIGFHNIVAHLEDRFPAPPLLIGDPMTRSRQRMVLWQLVEKLENANVIEVLCDFEPYVTEAVHDGTYLTGDNPTIVDIAVAALCVNEPPPFYEFHVMVSQFCRQQAEVA
jgi:glutathione S-transferase